LEDNIKSVCSQIEIIKELKQEEIKQLTTGLYIRKNGTKEWYENEKLHRFNGPADDYSNGNKY
jgi:hypothetical protein